MAEEDIKTTEEHAEKEINIPKRKDLLSLIREWPLVKKIALLAVTVLSIAIFSIIIIQARTADFQLLYANLTEKDAASVVTWLKGQRIDYQLKNGGKNIWISAEKLYETRLELASGGLPSGGGVGFEVFDKQSFALTDFVQKVNYTRALQGELARTITSLQPVESTRVHLVIPEKRLFKNQQKKASASIIISLNKTGTLTKSQVQGIIHLVSGSVEGLDASDVRIIDSSGNILKGLAKQDNDQRISVERLVFQQQIEQRMETRAQDLLDKTMGKGQAMVRVTAALDFAKVEKTEELFDSEEPVIRSEQFQQETSGTRSNGGIPGVESNLQGNNSAANSSSSPKTKTSRTTNYEISKTISKTVNPVGTIKSISVSVLLADKIIPAKDEESQPTSETRNEKELKVVETMVSSALGLNVERGDNINVTSMPFVATSDEQIAEGALPANSIYEYLPIIKIALLFMAALLFYFLLVRPLVKTLKSEVTEHNKTVTELEQAALDIQEAKEREQREKDIVDMPEDIESDSVVVLRNEIMQNHVPTAYIIKNWINEG